MLRFAPAHPKSLQPNPHQHKDPNLTITLPGAGPCALGQDFLLRLEKGHENKSRYRGTKKPGSHVTKSGKKTAPVRVHVHSGKRAMQLVRELDFFGDRESRV